MDLGLAKKTVVVTGASRGIGYACARAFAAEGANLVISARSEAPLQVAADELRNTFSVRVDAYAGDLTDPASTQNFVETIKTVCAVPDVLVMNTGRPPAKLTEVIDEIDEARWDEAHSTQLRSAVRLVNAVSRLMVERRHGRIVAITSASVKHPMPRHGLSTIYRGGLTAFLKHLATEIAASGVTVNMVAPASVATETFLSHWNAEERLKLVPLKRLGKPEELASAVLYFASVQAGFITGVHLPVDGGMTASLV